MSDCSANCPERYAELRFAIEQYFAGQVKSARLTDHRSSGGLCFGDMSPIENTVNNRAAYVVRVRATRL